MSLLLDLQTKFTFKILGASFDTKVAEATLEEGISVPYQADVVLASEDAIALDDALGKEGLLTLGGEGADRLIHGIINRFAQTGKRGRFFLYEARLVPQMWLLSQEQDSRIFQNENVQDIVTKILKEGKVPADRMDFRLKEKYPAKEFAVQYQETDLAFISRLLEEDGIWYFFEQSEDKHVVVFADGKPAYKPIAGGATIGFKQAEGMPPEEEVVYQWASAKNIVPGKMSQTDFNYNKPSVPLKTEEQAKKNEALEIYEHPGRYDDADTGKRLTKVRLEERTAREETGEGFSTCPRLAPGYTFKLKDHETQAFNREYLVVSVRHQGKEPQVLQEVGTTEGRSYNNRFTAIPSDATFRPERKTPEPVILGPQTAMVVGPDGEEIYTDEQGRIKVKFHWDRAEEKNEKSSCWIRVGQLWAGEGWGSMFVPRKGQEVIVSFMDGDPDRPIVTGRVYNGANPPPHPLPASKTKSTIMSQSSQGGGGSNELSFEDSKGKEQIFLHAQKDMTVDIANDKNQTVGHDETLSVKSNRTKKVTVNETIDVGGDEKVAIGGSESSTVGVNRTAKITGNETMIVGGSETIKISGTQTETITLAAAESIGLAKALSIGAAYQVSVGGLMNETVALAKAEEVGGAKAVIVGKTMFEKVAGTRMMQTGKTHTIKAKDILVEAESSITIKTGKAVIKMAKNGDISLSGNNISMNGKDLGIIGSGKINMKATGKMLIKGQKVAVNP